MDNSNQSKITSENKRTLKSSGLIWSVPMTALAVVGGYGGSWLERNINKNSNVQDISSTVAATESSIASVAARVSPSVVSIVTESQSQRGAYSYIGQAAGTGVIISKNGYIITNKHVINSAKTISAVTSDGESHEAKLVGTDPTNDLAFIKISGNNFTPAGIGDSSSLKIGQGVVAVGNALGQYQNTVTSGIVSGVGRSVVASSDGTARGAESLSDLIQTDTAINSGNSGGPLVNLQGQVVGINTAVASDAQGLGFAIPINAAKGMMRSVIENGNVQRPFLGVNYLDITPEVKSEYDLSVGAGGYVFNDGSNAVQSGSPADKAGIKDGDIIQKIGDKTVGVDGGVATLIGEYASGDNVKITILRDGKTIELDVKLGSMPSSN